mgnify:CR=1 FL=1
MIVYRSVAYDNLVFIASVGPTEYLEFSTGQFKRTDLKNII